MKGNVVVGGLLVLEHKEYIGMSRLWSCFVECRQIIIERDCT